MMDKFKFCPHCAAPVEYKPVPDDTQLRHVCTQCQVIHYLNPKIVTGVLPIFGDQVLLARRAIEPRKGHWNVPAGYMENGETIEDGAQRELQEEANAKVKNILPHLIYSIAAINQVYVLFVGELLGPNYSAGIESLEVKLFTQAEIPWDEMAFTSSKVCIERHFENQKKNSSQIYVEQYIHNKNL